ncbi:MAG: ubiquitin-like domain-containing protein [Chloroflexota bacterium]
MNYLTKRWSLAAALCVLLGAALLYFGLQRPVTLVVDGKSYTLPSRAFSVGAVLAESGIPIHEADRITPPLNAALGWGAAVRLERARPVQILDASGGDLINLHTAERIPANLLAQAGLRLFPADRLEWNGAPLDPAEPLPDAPSYLLVYRPATPIEVTLENQRLHLISAQPTLLGALAEAGIHLRPADHLSLPAETPLTGRPLSVSIEPARTVQIIADGKTHTYPVNAETVGEALAQAQIPLQDQDYSLPAEDQPIPPDRTIRIVRVREEVLLEQKPIPFNSTYQPDPNTELDQRSVVKAGELGVEVSRVRVRYEDGAEVSRQSEASWVAKEPVDQVLGYGTQVVVRTLETPEGTFEYWRKVTAFATSYHPCGFQSGCSYITASGATLQKGIVAVTRAWYSWMRGQRVYIPGYGTAVVADTGGGYPDGRNWIDLGYSDADYVPWASYVEVYFLTPVPASIPWILP